MNKDIENKNTLINALINFFNINKIKIYILAIILIIISISSFFYKIHLEKKNYLIAERYIKAGLILATGKEVESTNIYKKILISKNTFYSILALNTIIEKDLITDENTILNYFLLLEGNIKSNDQKDLLNFKKALYLMKNKKTDQAEKILEKLISKESKFKLLAEEIITR